MSNLHLDFFDEYEKSLFRKRMSTLLRENNLIDKSNNKIMINTYKSLEKGSYYWVLYKGKFEPTMVCAPFKPDELYFRFLNGMQVECENIQLFNVLPLTPPKIQV